MFGWFKSLMGIPGPVERGIDLLEAGDYENAAKSFEEARAAGDESDLLFQSMARVSLSLDRVDDAVRHATRATLIKPMNPANHAVLASALHRGRRNAEAMKTIDDGLRIDPKNAYLHYLKGVVLLSDGDSDSAVAHFEEFMAFNHSISMARIFTVGESVLSSLAHSCATKVESSGESGKPGMTGETPCVKSCPKTGTEPDRCHRPAKLLASLSRKERESYERGLSALDGRDPDMATIEFEVLARKNPSIVLARILTACEIYLKDNFKQKHPENRF